MIGTALGTAVAGALLGPALGALAAAIGTEPVFGSVLVVALALAYRRLAPARGAGAASARRLREVAATMLEPADPSTRPPSSPSPSLMFGAIEVLVPLRIDALGGGHARDRRRLHRRRRRWRRCWRRSPAATPTGSGGARPTSSASSICAVAMVVIALGRRRSASCSRR